MTEKWRVKESGVITEWTDLLKSDFLTKTVGRNWFIHTLWTHAVWSWCVAARRLQSARQDVQRVSQKEWWSPRCRRAASSRSSSPASSPCHSPCHSPCPSPRHSPCPSPRPSITQAPLKTKLQLVDLAGSECVGKRLQCCAVQCWGMSTFYNETKRNFIQFYGVLNLRSDFIQVLLVNSLLALMLICV